MNLKDIRKKFEDVMNAKREKAAEIDQLKKELESVNAEMLSAADRGDLDEYKRLDEKKRDIEARIFVYSRSLPNPKNAITREDVTTAWNGFAKSYDKDTKAKYEAFMKDCKALKNKYAELVSIQNAALAERERAYEIMGEAKDSDALQMYMIPCTYSDFAGRWRDVTPEIGFFAYMGLITSDEAEDYIGIIEGQRATIPE